LDVLSINAPLTADTKGIINADVLSKMPENAILVNAARGGGSWTKRRFWMRLTTVISLGPDSTYSNKNLRRKEIRYATATT